MGIYTFKPEDAYRFADEQHIPAKLHGDELIFSVCPYCKERTDKKNKFAINIRSGAFNCLRATCGAKGNMLTLAKDFDFSLGRDVDEYYNRTRKFRDIRKYGTVTIRTGAAIYMATRGIGSEISNKYRLTTQKDNDDVLVFPFYDERGDLQFIKYRKMHYDPAKDKNKEWSEPNCKPILFGMDLCDATYDKKLILTEGQIDSLSVAQAYDGKDVNVVSVPTGARGFTWVPYCWDFLGQFETLVVFGDCEDGHITLLDEMSRRFHGTVKHVRVDDYLGCKDANEILQKHGELAVCYAVEHAEIVENPHIKKLSHVERRENETVINTGIRQLNQRIGGFSFGQMVILTGARGLGKSTLGSQFILEAVEQGYPSIIYSGELMDWQVQEWIDRQAAGRENINKAVGDSGFVRYLVETEAVERIHAWYDPLLFIRENQLMFSDAETEALIETLHTAITQYGVKVILIDNLMTAIEDDLSSDLYRQQSAFVRDLVRTAKEFDVLIILVAHPRKRQGQNFDNDDIAGSGNIANLADIVINYTTPPNEQNDSPRVLQITKNRINGMLTYEGIPLYYEDESKRITETKYAPGKRYGWEDDAELWRDADNAPDTIPF